MPARAVLWWGVAAAGLVFLSTAQATEEETVAAVSSDIEVSKEPVKLIQAPAGKAVSKTNLNLGEGMEVVEMGGTNVLVPKGARVSKEHGMIVYEDTGEFLARRFFELEARLEALEKEQQALKALVEELHAKDKNKSLISR